MKRFNVVIDVRTKDIDGNKIDTEKIIKRLDKFLSNEWNVCAYGVVEKKRKLK